MAMKDKVTVPELARMKSEERKITMLTAYDYPFARIFDLAGIDVLLVGDSLAMVVQGHQNTLPATVDQVVYHLQMVARGRRRALLVGDMPFLSYHASVEQAVFNAGRLIKEGGAEAVKLEGGTAMADTVRRLVDVDIPVMGHIGLTPQSVHRMGGHRVQGKRAGRAPGGRERLLDDAAALDEAGVFAMVLEGIPVELTQEIAEKTSAPTIGIGAGAGCDGQVLVMHDLLGLTERALPRFAKAYAAFWREAGVAAASFIREVREGTFPAAEHHYGRNEIQK
jgi:3-methyl-2-oxobutanoate hydroxymethyltransferase